jgi:hypothetical protein
MPAADDDRDLDPGLVYGDDLSCQGFDPFLVDAELEVAAQRLPGELEHDA